MIFTQETRKLESETGFLRFKNTGYVCNYAIYLGKGDSQDNYEEVSEEVYNEYLETQNEHEETPAD